MAAECGIPLDVVPKLAATAAEATAATRMAAMAAPPAAANVQTQQLQLVHFVVGSQHLQISGVAKTDQLQIPGAAMAMTTDGATAAKRKKASPPSSSSSSSTSSSSDVNSPAQSPAAPSSLKGDSNCTICGRNFVDKSAFNAHIKAHLKEKLTSRRAEKQRQESQAQQSAPPGKNNKSVAAAAAAEALGQGQQQSVAPAAPGSSGQRKRKKASTPTPPCTPAPATPLPPPPSFTSTQMPALPQAPAVLLHKQPLLPPPLTGPTPPPQSPSQKAPLSLASHHQVMAELAACRPIPPSQQQSEILKAAASSEPLPPPLPPPAVLKPQQAPKVPSTTLAATSGIGMAKPKLPEEAAQQHSTSKPQQQPQQQPQPQEAVTLPLDNLCTPEISDMEEDLMSYEMEMNRIDFHNDLSTILDQLEKDFESPGLMGGDFMMEEMAPHPPAAIETPPDSDSEFYCQKSEPLPASSAASALSPELQSLVTTAAGDPAASLKPKPAFPIVTSSALLTAPSEVTLNNGQQDLLGFDRFVRVQSAMRPPPPAAVAAAAASQPQAGALNARPGAGCTVVQSPASLAKVGPLNPRALAVLSQLPSKLFPTTPGADSTRLVNVVKVENATATGKAATAAATAAAAATEATAVTPYTVINIECHQPGKNGEIEKKVLETYRAIETRGEIKLVAVGSTTVVAGEQPRAFGGSANDHHGGGGGGSSQQPAPSPMSTCSSSHDSAIDSPMSGMSTDDYSVFERQVTKKPGFPQSCNQCPEKFSKLSELLEHQIITHQNQEHRCENCGQAFSSQVGLLGHRRSRPECGLVLPSPPSRPPAQQQSRQKPFACRSCKRTFTQRGHLNRHEKTHGSGGGGGGGGGSVGEVAESKTKEAAAAAYSDEFACKLCGKRCKNNAGLARHRTKHLTCVQCAVAFDSKAALQDHLFQRHAESAVITVEKPPPPPPMTRAVDGDESEGEDRLRTTTSAAATTATATTRGDSFLVSCYADEDEDDDDQVKLPGLLGSSSKGLSPDALGESLVDISDSNFFDFDKDLNDELYSTADLF